jgi:phosphoglycolate phosphatase
MTLVMKEEAIRNVLFDLDGTLADSSPGILATYRHVCSVLNIEVSAASLKAMIGHPLEEVLAKLLPPNHPASPQEAVRLYRKRYESDGLYQATIFPGIFELLRNLRDAGYRLFVATNKISFSAEPFCKVHGITPLVEKVYGIRPDDGVKNKVMLVRYLLAEEKLNRAETILVGDRRDDMEAARENEIKSAAVGWGFGTREELDAARPTYFVESPSELFSLLDGRGTVPPVPIYFS